MLAEPVAALVGALGQLLTGMQRRESIPQIEVSLSDGEQVLVLRVLDALPPGDVAALRDFERVHGLRILLQPGGLDSVEPLTPGPVDLHYRLEDFDLRLDFGPTDFVQVNGAINAGMVARAIELLEVSPADRVLDLYCGLGNFTLPLARRAASVVGVEGEAGLIERARANARPNGIEQRHFPRGRPVGGPRPGTSLDARGVRQGAVRPAAGGGARGFERRGTSCAAQGGVYLLPHGLACA